MFCSSCKEEIPPTWSFAVVKNFCPKCGGRIMDEDTQELMVGLTTAMQQMSDPIAIVSWLMSNYKLQKIGEYDPVITKNNKQVITSQKEEVPSKHSAVIAHIQKMSGLDKTKNQSVKSLLEKSESQTVGKESLVSMGNEPEDASGFNQEVPDEIDEIDELMNSGVLPNFTTKNESIESIYENMKMKQLSSKQNVLGGGSPGKNSFTRVG